MTDRIINQNTPTLSTQRLTLRKFTSEDLEDCFSLYSDETVNVFLPWFPHKSIDETARYLEEIVLTEYEKTLAYCYAITLKNDNHVIGYVTVHDIESNEGVADLGYALKYEFWHMGIVTEACKAVIEQLRRDGFVFLTATHDVKNIGSGKVMKKLGMKYCYSYVERCQPKDIDVTFRLYQLNFDGNTERVNMKYWNKYENHFFELDV